MTPIDIFILAVALSIDASIVSFSNGLLFSKNAVKNSLLLAFFVSFFQFIMPIIGGGLAYGIIKYVSAYSHWIVFTIFFVIGLNFIREALSKDEEQKAPMCAFCLKYLFIISVATSIDALAAGASLSLTGVKVFLPAILIGIITFVNSLIGFWIGHFVKKFPVKNLEALGGIILILLAFKILLESLNII